MSNDDLPGDSWVVALAVMIVCSKISILTLFCLPPEYLLLQPKQKNHYMNVRCPDRFIWDQQEICSYNTEVGFYVSCLELGHALAEYWIRLQWLSYLWASRGKYCSCNQRRFQTQWMVGERFSKTVCSAARFYPSQIKIKWFENGQKEMEKLGEGHSLLCWDRRKLEKNWGENSECIAWALTLWTALPTEIHSGSAEGKKVPGLLGFVLNFIMVGAHYLSKRKER
uniref:Uncharacterized protein n=1 Tax=Anser cygnoides TaxID=8845 RepID=A0A8B9DK63_ANSCY